MSIEKNNSLQIKLGIVLSYVAIAVNMLVQLLYTPLLIQQLGQSEYGLYTLVGSVVNYLSLFSLGFGGAYLRFYSRYESKNDTDGIARLNGMFLTLFLTMAGLAFAVGNFFAGYTELIFGENLTVMELKKAEILMRILVINICLTFPDSVFSAIITAHEKFIFQKTLQIVSNLLNPFLCLPLLFMGFDSVAVVSVTTGITVFKLCIHIFYCFKHLHVRFSFREFRFSLLKEISRFSFFLFLNMIIDQINWSVDKFILGRVAGTGAVAIYGVAAMINTLYLSFSTAVSNVFVPRVNRIVASRSIDYKKQLTDYFIKVGRIQFMIIGLILSGFIIFGEYFITNIYLSAEYKEVYAVTLFLIVPVTIPLIQNLGIEIQCALNKHQFRSGIYMLMAVLNVVISVPLAKKWGPLGTAMGTAFSLLLANGLIMNVYYYKVLEIDVKQFWKSILQLARSLFAPAIVGVALFYTGYVNSIQRFGYCVLIYIFVYVSSLWLWGMNDNEKNMIQRISERIRRK